jgi:uncharacterized membrane protein
VLDEQSFNRRLSTASDRQMFDLGIFLAALGITVLELAEASAVGLTLYAESNSQMAFLSVGLGVVSVFIPTGVVGGLIALLPVAIVRLTAATLLLYFGLRLLRSARRAVLRSRGKGVIHKTEKKHAKGLFAAGFSVGAVEAFEAAIVLVALLPNNYSSTVYGLMAGVVVVVAATYFLQAQVRRVKQANMKVFVSALLLSFSVFWYAETVRPISDLVLLPLFAFFALVVYRVANRRTIEVLENGRLSKPV